jgi:glutamate-ammonia-ligase adenylyltransferase
MSDADAVTLEHAWATTSRLRNALVLWRGRATDVMPTDRRDLDGAARLLGYAATHVGALEDDVLRTTRHARSVVERIFYG